MSNDEKEGQSTEISQFMNGIADIGDKIKLTNKFEDFNVYAQTFYMYLTKKYELKCDNVGVLYFNVNRVLYFYVNIKTLIAKENRLFNYDKYTIIADCIKKHADVIIIPVYFQFSDGNVHSSLFVYRKSIKFFELFEYQNNKSDRKYIIIDIFHDDIYLNILKKLPATQRKFEYEQVDSAQTFQTYVGFNESYNVILNMLYAELSLRYPEKLHDEIVKLCLSDISNKKLKSQYICVKFN